MLSTDRDALQCDLMEVYGISDMKALPAGRAAVFACGLGRDSRIMMALRGDKLKFAELASVLMYDRLGELLYVTAKGAGFRRFKKPSALLERLQGQACAEKVMGFASGEEFLKEYKRLGGG